MIELVFCNCYYKLPQNWQLKNIGLSVNMEKQVNAVLTSSHDHIKITTELQNKPNLEPEV